jgi:hypothetical protein
MFSTDHIAARLVNLSAGLGRVTPSSIVAAKHSPPGISSVTGILTQRREDRHVKVK